MKEDRARLLKRYALWVAGDMDNRREITPEGFSLQRLVPLSDSTAIGIFLKTSGKWALVFFRWQNWPSQKWVHFFPTGDDLEGMMRAQAWRELVEEHNLKIIEEGE